MARAKQRPSSRQRPAQGTPPATPPAQPKDQYGQTAEQRQSAVERRAQRAAEAKRMQQRRQIRNLLIGLAVAGVVAAIAFFFIRQQLALQEVGVKIADEGRGHVNEGTVLTFQHIPPSSGTHYPSAQPAGIYRDQEISEGYFVHSLEHGYVVALVNCTTNCGPLFDQLQGIYDDLPDSRFGNVKFLALKYNKPFTDGNSPPITLLAWNHEMQLASVDREQIELFYKKFVDQGPENVP